MYFEIYQQSGTGGAGILAAMIGGQWRWRLRAANHEIIASGEAYVNKADCLRAIDLVRGTDKSTPIRPA